MIGSVLYNNLRINIMFQGLRIIVGIFQQGVPNMYEKRNINATTFEYLIFYISCILSNFYAVPLKQLVEHSTLVHN